MINNVNNELSTVSGAQALITSITTSTNNYIPFSGLINDIADIIITSNANSLSIAIHHSCNSGDTFSITNLPFSYNYPNSETCSINQNIIHPFTSFSLYGKCTSNQKMVIVASAVHSTLGNVFDMKYEDELLGAQTTSTIQACMATFSSGGSNDKDACRDVITKKCGMNIDYQCKKSGFYDYINANPNSVPLPPECTSLNQKQCFEWIEKYFFAGQLVVKPSAFVGYNLYLSTSVHTGSTVLDGRFYNPPQYTDTTQSLTELTALQGYHSTAQNKIQILGTTINSNADISEKTVLMDKAAYKILHDGAKSLSYGFMVIILNIALLI